MKYVLSALNWIFGVLFLVLGLVLLFSDPLPGIPLIIIALFLLPPVRQYIQKKTNKQLPAKSKALIIIVLLIIFGIFIPQSQKKEETERLAEQRQDLKEKANSLLEEQKRKEEAILVELKTIPLSEYKRNLDLYKQLVSLNPNNDTYSQKVKYYSDRYVEQTEKERKQKEAVPVVEYEILDSFKPNKEPNGFGAVILLKSDLSENKLISFVKKIAANYDPVLIRVFISREAYQQEKTNNYGQEYKSGYILFYVKNKTGRGAYRGFNEIRWMQEVGKFSGKFGLKTKL